MTGTIAQSRIQRSPRKFADDGPRGDLSTKLFPVSIKVVLWMGGKVLLLFNDRHEWELLGGKLAPGEQPKDCVAREVKEETGLDSEIGRLVSSCLNDGRAGDVVSVIYEGIAANDSVITPSEEHRRLELLDINEIDNLPMPTGHKEAIYLSAGMSSVKYVV